MKENILQEYQINKRKFEAFKDKIERLIKDLLGHQNIIVHQVNCRVKDFESLSKKIDQKQKYKSINEITDIIGVRIITYLESDVDSVKGLIQNEFVVDVVNSIDKRRLNKDQFGYRSLHLVVSVNDNRNILPEYGEYKDIRIEIQIRSILQHAWTEIEHDLGYKGNKGIPELFQRSFNRLAALLETADIEFDRLKSELSEYDRQVPDLVKDDPEDVELNKNTVQFFVKNSSILTEARETIAEISGAIFGDYRKMGVK